MSADLTPEETPAAERPVGAVRGTRDWLPDDFERLSGLEALLLDRFARAGYRPLRTPVIEPTELHERKSGAGIVSKLFALSGVTASGTGGVCLRPELTAGIVRAYAAAEPAPPLPWRVSHAGTVFRDEAPRPGRLREFQQVGVERIGDAGPHADAEAVWLAATAAAEAGVRGAKIRIGHVGVILDLLDRAHLTGPTRSSIIELLSEAAAGGRGVRALEASLDRVSSWLGSVESADDALRVEIAEGRAVDDRLFRMLVPVITGRRSGHDVLGRLRRKWALARSLREALARLHDQFHRLADLRGPAPEVLARVESDPLFSSPASFDALRGLVAALGRTGVDPGSVEIDLGFGRGIGFYTQMIFEVVVDTPGGPQDLCGGGRYDGLAQVLGSPADGRGVGFAFGLERLLAHLEQGGPPGGGRRPRGCQVVATPRLLGEASGLCARLRGRDGGRWPDGGPVVGPDPFDPGGDPARAQDAARALGVAALIALADEPGRGLVPACYEQQGGRWVRVDPERFGLPRGDGGAAQ